MQDVTHSQVFDPFSRHEEFVINTFFSFFFLSNRLVCPETCLVDQAGLELRDPSASGTGTKGAGHQCQAQYCLLHPSGIVHAHTVQTHRDSKMFIYSSSHSLSLDLHCFLCMLCHNLLNSFSVFNF